MRKKLIVIFGLLFILSLTACTPDGEVDLSVLHNVVDFAEESINKVDKEAVRQDLINGLDKASDLLDKVSDAVEENKLTVTPTTTPTPEPEEVEVDEE